MNRFHDSPPLKNWLCYSLWLFHLHSAVKIQPFYPLSSWRDPRLMPFSGYPFGTSRKKASTIFYNTAKKFPISCSALLQTGKPPSRLPTSRKSLGMGMGARGKGEGGFLQKVPFSLPPIHTTAYSPDRYPAKCASSGARQGAEARHRGPGSIASRRP